MSNFEPIDQSIITPEQSEEFSSLLWEKLEEIGDIRTALSLQLEEMYAEVEAKQASRPNLHDQKLIAELETEYWKLYGQLQEILKVEEVIFVQLEKLENGTITSEEISTYLPAEESSAEMKLSKRRQAIAKQKAKEEKFKSGQTYSFLGEVGLLYLFSGHPTGPSPTTDPRRISSGNNRRRVTSSSGQGVSAIDFYGATADTHGGKTRSFGKSGKDYVGKSGRRIRKY
jgi:hypothetical protein